MEGFDVSKAEDQNLSLGSVSSVMPVLLYLQTKVAQGRGLTGLQDTQQRLVTHWN